MRISDWSSDVCSSDLAAGKAEQLVLRADEDLHTLRCAGEVEQADERVLGFQEVEELADALQILQRVHILQELRLAAQDEGAALDALAAAPACQPALDNPLAELVELGESWLHLPQPPRLGPPQRAPGYPPA